MSDRLAIGLDLGGTQLRAALVDEAGRVLKRLAVPTAATAGPEVVLAQIEGAVREIAEGVAADRLAGIGVCAPGPLDSVNGYVIWAPTIAGFRDIPLARLLTERTGLLARLENDGIAAVLGEWRFGAGRGCEHLVYVTVSTGIGGGVVADGRVLRGRRGMAAHVGHMTIIRDGDTCSCGNRGCWEAYASGTAFTQRARRRAAADQGSVLARQATTLEGRDVFKAAGEGDALALALVAEEADYLGIGIAGLLHLYSPERVIVGGGMANGFDALHAGMMARVGANAMAPFRDVPVLKAELGDNSGLIGAASMLLETELSAG